jgi:hypothetical protein
VTFVRCTLEVTTAGKLRLNLHDSRGLSLWIDGTPAEIGNTIALPLAQGIHVLSFRVDTKLRHGAPLRCELTDLPGSAAHGRFMSGR